MGEFALSIRVFIPYAAFYASIWLAFLYDQDEYSNTNWGGKFWSYPAIVKDKAIRLLLPGLVFSIVALALKVVFPGEMSRQVGLCFSDIVHSYLYPNDNPMRELWFIATLFGLFLLTPLWKMLLKKDGPMLLAVFILIVLHLCHLDIELLCIGRVFKYAIWFYLGLVISKMELVEKLLNKNAWLTILVGVIIYLIGIYTDDFIKTIGGITLSFGLALLFDKYLPKLFFSFRDYTYQIFLVGIFAQIFVKIIYRHLHMPYVLAYLLCIAAGLYVPVIVSIIIKKTKWKPLLMCLGLK